MTASTRSKQRKGILKLFHAGEQLTEKIAKGLVALLFCWYVGEYALVTIVLKTLLATSHWLLTFASIWFRQLAD